MARPASNFPSLFWPTGDRPPHLVRGPGQLRPACGASHSGVVFVDGVVVTHRRVVRANPSSAHLAERSVPSAYPRGLETLAYRFTLSPISSKNTEDAIRETEVSQFPSQVETQPAGRRRIRNAPCGDDDARSSCDTETDCSSRKDCIYCTNGGVQLFSYSRLCGSCLVVGTRCRDRRQNGCEQIFHTEYAPALIDNLARRHDQPRWTPPIENSCVVVDKGIGSDVTSPDA